jgi:hypothetical protein
MLIRITILNRFNRIEVFNHLRRDRKLGGSKRVELNRDRLGNQVSEEVSWCTTARPCTTSWSGSTGTMIRMRMNSDNDS